MNSRLVATLGAAVLLIGLTPAMAQWPDYPTVNVPLTAEGEPDLDAPPPRMADGHVDFSGVWAAGLGFGGGRGGFGGRGRGGGGGRAAAAGGGQDGAAGRGAGRGGAPAAFGGGRQGGRPPVTLPEDGTPPLATFFDIGANIPGGAPYQPWARELRDQRVADGDKDNPDAHCLPMGHMQFHLHPQPRKVIQKPDLMVILYEGNQGVRQIYTDGRPLPPDNVFPWWYGYSVGHWEDDTLVVETTHMKDDGWLDVNGSPFTSKGRIIERFTRPTVGRLIIDVTIDDPTVYTEPFTVRVNQRLLPNEQLIEFVCENEKSSYLYDQ